MSEADKEAERKRKEKDERTRIELLFRDKGPEEREKIEQEARESLAKMGITQESEAKK